MVKNLSCHAGDAGDVSLIPGSGRSPGEGNDNPPQYSCLKNPMDREPGRLQFIGSQEVRHNLALSFFLLACSKADVQK